MRRLTAVWLAALTVALIFPTAHSAAADSGSCTSAGNLISACNSGTQLDVGGTQTDPGSESWTPETVGAFPPPPPTRPTARERGYPDCAPDAELCTPVWPDAEPEEDAEDDAIPAVTLADLASFAPAPPALTAQPTAAGVVGMPTNFVATAEEQIVGGTLFGLPVTARFTPVAYVFAYGDGSSGRSTTGGASWEALGQAQFTATATSHAYGARGTYVASVTVEYAPAVDFGTGWIPVAGVVTSQTGGYDVTVYEVRTALVERTCLENPSGPGC